MRNMANEEIVCSAIKHRKQIRFRYKDQSHHREFNPHAVYYSAKDSSVVMTWGIQIRNEEEPLAPRGIRKFEVSLMIDISILDRVFQPDPNFIVAANEFRNGIICAVGRS